MKGYMRVVKEQRNAAREQRNAAWDRILSQSALSMFEQADVRLEVQKLQQQHDGVLLQLVAAQQERDEARQELHKATRQLNASAQGLNVIPSTRAFAKYVRKQADFLARQCTQGCTKKSSCRSCLVARRLEAKASALLVEVRPANERKAKS